MEIKRKLNRQSKSCLFLTGHMISFVAKSGFIIALLLNHGCTGQANLSRQVAKHWQPAAALGNDRSDWPGAGLRTVLASVGPNKHGPLT